LALGLLWRVDFSLAGAVFLYDYVSDSLRNIWLELVEPFPCNPPPGTITDRTLFIGDRVSVGLHVASPVVGERVRKWSRKRDDLSNVDVIHALPVNRPDYRERRRTSHA